MNTIISLQKVSKYYGTTNNPIVAVKDLDLQIEKGSFTVILGRSGSGKSTLLNLISGLDKVSDGEIIINGQNLSKVSSRSLASYRAKNGIIFQSYNLLPNLNTLENVLMGSWAGGKQASEETVKKLLKDLGIEHRVNANVKTLSGGEKQRVAIARSLISDPEILFCDEPTGALDSASEKQVQEILYKLYKDRKLTIVLVTHNSDFRKFANQVIEMEDGKIAKIETKTSGSESTIIDSYQTKEAGK